MIESCMREGDLREYLRDKLKNLLAGQSRNVYLRENIKYIYIPVIPLYTLFECPEKLQSTNIQGVAII